MAKCPNCNTEIENGARFCGECGSPVPEQTNPGEYLLRYMDASGKITSRGISQVLVLSGTMFQCFCHLRNDQRDFQFANVIDITPYDTGVTSNDAKALFIQRNVDGCERLVATSQPAAPATPTVPAMSIGDKNVISGDVIQQKSSYNVQGNIINETQSDETKLVKTCSVCGIHVPNDNGYTCPKCQQFVCTNHFDVKLMVCHSCREFAVNSAKMEYYRVYTRILETCNGIINIESRKELDELKNQLGLSDEDVSKVEASVTVDTGLSRIEKMELQSAMQQVIQGDGTSCLAKLEKMHSDHPDVIEVTAVYQRALKMTDPEALKTVAKKFSVESVLSLSDLSIQEGNFYFAEKKIFETKDYADYGADPLLACEEAYYRTVVGARYNKSFMWEKAKEIVYTIAPSDNQYLMEFVEFVRKLIDVVSGIESKDALKALAPYWQFMAKPVLDTEEEPSAKTVTVSDVETSIELEDVSSLVASWKQQVAEKQQKEAEKQKSLQEIAARHQEADLLREQQRAAEEEAAKQKAEAAAARYQVPEDLEDLDEETREMITELAKEMNISPAEARKIVEKEIAEEEAEKARKAEERAAERARKEEERQRKAQEREEERQRKAREREEEKARKEAEKLRRAEIAASVQPFAAEGEYQFKYQDRYGVVSDKLGTQIFISDGLRFRCRDPRDPMGDARTYLFEGVIEIKESNDSEVTSDALSLFRKHEVDAMSNGQRDPFAAPPKSLQELTGALNDASAKFSKNLNDASANLRKSTEQLKAEMQARVKDVKPVVAKAGKGCLILVIALVVLGIVVKLVGALLSGGSPLDDYYQESFKYEKLVDARDKQEYRVIQIGGQKWIAQNMNYAVDGSVCDSCDLYGRLYTYDAALQSCPAGYTLPTKADLEALNYAVDDVRSLLSVKGWSNAGSDGYGFAAIPGGFYSFKDGVVKRRGEIAGYWTSTDYQDYAVRMKLDSDKGDIALNGLSKQYGFSVRCISKASSNAVAASNDIVIDRRNEKVLETISIGGQKWIASNMNVKMAKSYCPEGEDTYCDSYGRLYEWSAALKACPAGYRLPNAADFEQLARSSDLSSFNYVYAGFRNGKGGYELRDARSDLWSSSEIGSNARYWYFRNGDSKLYSNKFSKTAAMSVRCIEGALEQNFAYSQIVDDRDDQVYNTVKIGKQVWMAQNLNLALGGSFCYENDEANCATYGRLYEWSDAMNICPDGFRLPEDKDWTELRNFVSSNGDGRVGTNLRAANLWNAGPGTDLFGFGAVPSGYYGREKDEFGRLGERSYLWSASEANADSASHWAIVGDSEKLVRVTVYKRNGRAVRCIQD